MQGVSLDLQEDPNRLQNLLSCFKAKRIAYSGKNFGRHIRPKARDGKHILIFRKQTTDSLDLFIYATDGFQYLLQSHPQVSLLQIWQPVLDRSRWNGVHGGSCL